METVAATVKTGKVIDLGPGMYGTRRVNMVKCGDCNTTFIGFPNMFRCNGHNMLDRCPWCRPDSRPWGMGRGE